MDNVKITWESQNTRHLSKIKTGAFLVAQWQRITLPMQETQVRPLIHKIPRTAEQLSPCSTRTEPALESPGAAWTEPAIESRGATRTEPGLQRRELQRLSLRSRARKPQGLSLGSRGGSCTDWAPCSNHWALEPALQPERPLQREAWAPRWRGALLPATRERPLQHLRAQHNQK